MKKKIDEYLLNFKCEKCKNNNALPNNCNKCEYDNEKKLICIVKKI